MSYTIKTPVENYSGVVAGVVFSDGVGNTDGDISYFVRHGYEIAESEAIPEPVAESVDEAEPVADAASDSAKTEKSKK